MKKIKMAVVIGALALTLTACMGEKAENKTNDNMNMSTEKMEMKDDMKDGEMKDGEMKDDMKEGTSDMSEGQKNEGMMAPEFSLTDAEGNTHTLSDMKGKKVYVKFWASWCPACLAGLDQLDELSKDNSEFEVISVVSPGMGGEKDKKDFIEWFSGLGHENIKVYFDESGEAMKNYGIRAYPTSAVIGSDGVLIGIQPGHLDNEVLKEVFKTVQ